MLNNVQYRDEKNLRMWPYGQIIELSTLTPGLVCSPTTLSFIRTVLCVSREAFPLLPTLQWNTDFSLRSGGGFSEDFFFFPSFLWREMRKRNSLHSGDQIQSSCYHILPVFIPGVNAAPHSASKAVWCRLASAPFTNSHHFHSSW